jgi:hypothetical protein
MVALRVALRELCSSRFPGDVFSQKGRKASAMSGPAKKSRATRQAEQGATSRSKSPAMTFLVFEDNGGDYCWAILDREGAGSAGS